MYVNLTPKSAGHAVYFDEDMIGHKDHPPVVIIRYHGFDISLASDGENTRVYTDRAAQEHLFETYGTGPEALKKCFAFVEDLKRVMSEHED